MSKKHIMIDLETLDRVSTSVILSIGAVVFDDKGNILDKLYSVVNIDSCVKAGMTTNKETIEWWQKQSKEAQVVLKDARHSDVTIQEALQELTHFIIKNDVIYVWGNGADFDNAMLQCAYDKVGMLPPWKFYNNRCYRTIKSMFPDIKMDRGGTYHNALDDALSQTKHLIKIMVEDELDDDIPF